MNPTKPSTPNPASDKQDKRADDQNPELSEQQLDKVSGGVIRRGGDDDLDDLEVER